MLEKKFSLMDIFIGVFILASIKFILIGIVQNNLIKVLGGSTTIILVAILLTMLQMKKLNEDLEKKIK